MPGVAAPLLLIGPRRWLRESVAAVQIGLRRLISTRRRRNSFQFSCILPSSPDYVVDGLLFRRSRQPVWRGGGAVGVALLAQKAASELPMSAPALPLVE